eukprot:130331-Chlamydomonas_euryale.AAC.1
MPSTCQARRHMRTHAVAFHVSSPPSHAHARRCLPRVKPAAPCACMQIPSGVKPAAPRACMRMPSTCQARRPRART